jgi:hypothetical protein
LSALLGRRCLLPAFDLANDLEAVLKLMQKYSDIGPRYQSGLPIAFAMFAVAQTHVHARGTRS